MWTNIKRMFKVAKPHIWLTYVSIAMILVIQVLGFISPLLVKSVLDDCLLGIEYPWVEVTSATNNTVHYNNHYYKQVRDLDQNDEIIKPISIVIYQDNYYLISEEAVEGRVSLADGKLLVTNDDGVYQYDYEVINAKDISLFYHPIRLTLLIVLILLGIKMIVTVICTYIQHIATNKMVNHMARAGRTAAIRACERLPIAEYEKEPAGKMASRITHDVDGLIIMYRQCINVFLSVVLSFIFAYVGMFYLNPKLALLSFLIYPIAALWIFIYLRYLKKIVEKVNEIRSLLTAKINEIINGIQILQVFNFKHKTLDEFNQISKNYKDEQLKEVKLHITGGWNLINIIKSAITALIVVYFGIQSTNIAGVVVTAGLIYAYNEYLLKIIEPINILFNQIGPFQHANVQISRIYKLIEADLESDEKTSIDRYHGDIRFDNVWFAYEENEYVLKGVSFNIKAGQLVGLVGHTGSGKSSLMNLLLQFYNLPSEHNGKIYVDDMDISQIPKRTYREHIGIVLQEPVLFEGTLASNIRFGKENVSDEQITKVLYDMGGERLLGKFKNGLAEPITRSGNNMSLGEKQIVSLARAIIQDPAILIMDEATSHIDLETEEIIKRALNIACKNRTVIVIAHRLSTVYNADKIIVLENGLKVEEGTHDELVANNKVYANIYRAQVANDNNE